MPAWRHRWMAGAAAALSGCVTAPRPAAVQAPLAEVTAGPTEIERAIERRRAEALRLEQTNDLAAAATQWLIVLLLAPKDRQAVDRLAALRASISKTVADELAGSRDALRRGDGDRAQQSLLAVLALDASNKEAIELLREIDRQRAMRRGADRAARAQAEQPPTATRGSSIRRLLPEAGEYDVEQSLELLRAGDSATAIAELRRYVAANSGDRALRERVAGALRSRAQALENQGDGFAAVELYAEAIRVRGSAPLDWTTQLNRLRNRLASLEYEMGVRMLSTDVAAATRHFEAALRLSPTHTQAQLQLDRAQKIQQKLRSIHPPRSPD